MGGERMGAFELDRARTCLLLIDYQERLYSAMPQDVGQNRLDNVMRMLKGAQALNLPLIVTEQYPQGIGPTLPAIVDAHPSMRPIAKTSFSCWKNEEARQAIEMGGCDTVLVMGMETHICVYQTVLDLLSSGRRVHVVADACLSRTEENWRLGTAMCRQAGAVVTGTETALFQLLGKAGGEAFKVIAKAIR